MLTWTRCVHRLGSALVSRLALSPPAWEYEPGSLAASSLVTALCDRLSIRAWFPFENLITIRLPRVALW